MQNLDTDHRNVLHAVCSMHTLLPRERRTSKTAQLYDSQTREMRTQKKEQNNQKRYHPFTCNMMSSIVRSILPEHRSEESQETETEITASDVPIKPFGQSKDSILVTHHQHRHDSHRTAATASPSEDSMSPSDNFREDQQGDRIKSRLDAVNENNKGAFLRMGSMVGSVTDKIRQHMVQFTRVNIHKHRMTLGNHPEGEQKMSRKKASSLFPVN